MSDCSAQIVERVRAAAAAKQTLRLRGGGTKDFYGNEPTGEILSMVPHEGVVDYEPTELVVTVRAGTPLVQLEALLAGRNQMLAFEPPHFGPGATVGGCVAAGLSGPRRATSGAVRDFVLGVKIVDGRGEVLRFGGQVMKNVAGYDVSRLMAGALGTLGVLLEVSLKVLPRPAQETTLLLEQSQTAALATMNRWAGQPLPVSATCWRDGVLSVRLSGARAAVAAARASIGGETLPEADDFWAALREQRLDFFAGERPLWRVSVASTAPALDLPGDPLLEWGGALRWVRAEADAARLREIAAAAGGHATLFRAADKRAGAFQALPAPLMRLHAQLQRTFDPHGIFNPGRLYAASAMT